MSGNRSVERHATMTAEEAAQYEASVVPRYSSLFGRMLLAELPHRERLVVLDIGCGTGYPALDVLARLGDTGRVIAIDLDATLVDIARRRALGEAGRRIFFKTESAEDLSFGDEVFDVVIGNLALAAFAQPDAALREIRRVLVGGGVLLLTHALEGTFEEVLDAFREIALKHDLKSLAQRIERVAARYPTPAVLEALLKAGGFGSVELRSEEFQFPCASADALLNDPVLRFVGLPEWRWIAGFDEGSEKLLELARSTLDTYFGGGPLTLRVRAGLVIARP